MDELRNNKSDIEWSGAKKFFSETMLVGLMTATGYMAAFVFQWNYLRSFRIPIYLVEVNLNLVLFLAFLGLLLILFVITVYDLIVRNVGQKREKVLLWILFTLVYWGPFLFLVYDLNHVYDTIASVAFALINIGYSSYKVYKYSPEQNYTKSLVLKLEKAYGSFPVIFAMIIVSFIFFSAEGGALYAKYKSWYLVSNTKQSLVILSTYSDSLIAIDFSTTTRSLNNKITLITPGMIESEKITFSSIKIGPFKSE